jgi:hypothetical protein
MQGFAAVDPQEAVGKLNAAWHRRHPMPRRPLSTRGRGGTLPTQQRAAVAPSQKRYFGSCGNRDNQRSSTFGTQHFTMIAGPSGGQRGTCRRSNSSRCLCGGC